MKVYLVHFRQTPLTFLICPDMVGVLRGKMTPVLRSFLMDIIGFI